MKTNNFYVTMTDKFMSGWGCAANKTNKLVISCPTIQHARAIQDAANNRNEMRYVNMSSKKPYYGKNILVSDKDFSDLGGHWLDYLRDYGVIMHKCTLVICDGRQFNADVCSIYGNVSYYFFDEKYYLPEEILNNFGTYETIYN